MKFLRPFKYIVAVFATGSLCAFAVLNKNNIDRASWLIGIWENKTQRGSIYESWTQLSETELLGKSYSVREGDTIVFENIRLVAEGNVLHYIPVVKNQNAGLPVRFTSTLINESKMIFENAQHDFPKLISYTRVGKDSLVAEISGVINGEARNQVFPMKRIE